MTKCEHNNIQVQHTKYTSLFFLYFFCTYDYFNEYVSPQHTHAFFLIIYASVNFISLDFILFVLQFSKPATVFRYVGTHELIIIFYIQ